MPNTAKNHIKSHSTDLRNSVSRTSMEWKVNLKVENSLKNVSSEGYDFFQVVFSSIPLFLGNNGKILKSVQKPLFQKARKQVDSINAFECKGIIYQIDTFLKQKFRCSEGEKEVLTQLRNIVYDRFKTIVPKSDIPIHQGQQHAQITYLGDIFEKESASDTVEKYKEVVCENVYNIISDSARLILQELEKMKIYTWIKMKGNSKQVDDIEQLLPLLNLFECQYILSEVKKEIKKYDGGPLIHYTDALERLNNLLREKRNLLRYGDDWEI